MQKFLRQLVFGATLWVSFFAFTQVVYGSQCISVTPAYQYASGDTISVYCNPTTGSFGSNTVGISIFDGTSTTFVTKPPLDITTPYSLDYTISQTGLYSVECVYDNTSITQFECTESLDVQKELPVRLYQGLTYNPGGAPTFGITGQHSESYPLLTSSGSTLYYRVTFENPKNFALTGSSVLEPLYWIVDAQHPFQQNLDPVLSGFNEFKNDFSESNYGELSNCSLLDASSNVVVSSLPQPLSTEQAILIDPLAVGESGYVILGCTTSENGLLGLDMTLQLNEGSFANGDNAIFDSNYVTSLAEGLRLIKQGVNPTLLFGPGVTNSSNGQTPLYDFYQNTDFGGLGLVQALSEVFSGDFFFQSGDIVEFFVIASNLSFTGIATGLTLTDTFPMGFMIDPNSVVPTPLSCTQNGLPSALVAGVDSCTWNIETLQSYFASLHPNASNSNNYAIYYSGVMTDQSNTTYGFYANEATLVDQTMTLADDVDVVLKPVPIPYCTATFTSSTTAPFSPFGLTIEVYNWLPFAGFNNLGIFSTADLDLSFYGLFGLANTGFLIPSSLPGNSFPRNTVFAPTEPPLDFYWASGFTYSHFTFNVPYESGFFVEDLSSNRFQTFGTGTYTFYLTGVDGTPFSCSDTIESNGDGWIRLEKSQRNITQGNPSSGYTTGVISHETGDVIAYKIEFENVSSLNFSSGFTIPFLTFQDMLPYGFCGTFSGTLSNGSITGLYYTGSDNIVDYSPLGYYNFYAYDSGSTLSSGDAICATAYRAGLSGGLAPGETGVIYMSGTMQHDQLDFYPNQVKLSYNEGTICQNNTELLQFLGQTPAGLIYLTGFDYSQEYQFWLTDFYNGDIFTCPVAESAVVLANTTPLPDLYVEKYHLAANDSGFSVACQDPSCTLSQNSLQLTTQDRMTYRIYVVNSGAGPAFDVTVNDDLPPGFTPVGNAPPLCSYSLIATNPAQYNLNCLDHVLPGGGVGAPGAEWTIDITGTILTGGQIPSYINIATLTTTTTGNCQVPNVCSTNPTTGVSLNVAQMQLTNQFAQPQAIPGDVVMFTLTYTNIGQQTGVSVELFDALPAGLIYIASSGDYTSFDVSTQSWQIGDVLPGSGGAIVVTAQVDPTYRNSLIDNTASIYEFGTFDANASDTLLVVNDVGVDIVKSIVETGVVPGDMVTFHIRYVNNLSLSIPHYSISDILPSTLQYISGSTSIVGMQSALYDPFLSGGRLVRECGVNIPTTVCPLGSGENVVLQFQALVN